METPDVEAIFDSSYWLNVAERTKQEQGVLPRYTSVQEGTCMGRGYPPAEFVVRETVEQQAHG